ncbi:MAG: acetylxylan esterase [Bacteroidales bacterium]
MKTCLQILILFLTGSACFSQPRPANYDENQIPAYTLPDPLICVNGKKITSQKEWEGKRRPEILELFREEVYGRVPANLPSFSWKVVRISLDALGGTAIRKDIQLIFSNNGDTVTADMIFFTPCRAKKAVPVFLGYNFDGNHTILRDPTIPLCKSWVANDPKLGINDNKANELSRGSDSSSWPVEEIIRRGYGLATIYYGDIDPDFDDGFQNGIHALVYGKNGGKPGPGDWGSIASWSWALSRALDYLQADPLADPKKVIVIGHSRLGKTALWAGAEDHRFALVVSNNSGCGGAALSMRFFGESVAIINNHFPHWFCDNYDKYNDKEQSLPVDQHELIALIAPRPVYIASATEDRWADPVGEFLGGVKANPVYHLYKKKGIERMEMPAPDQPDMAGSIGYHLRTGGHAITLYDWECYMDFADKMLK